jgi:hypothetical protein
VTKYLHFRKTHGFDHMNVLKILTKLLLCVCRWARWCVWRLRSSPLLLQRPTTA